MATSRTGTTEYFRWRRTVLRIAQASGVTNCPHCGVTLDYLITRQPNSAEPDHVIPWANGGTNDVDNGTVCCRRCNQSKGNRDAPRARTIVTAAPLKTSRTW